MPSEIDLSPYIDALCGAKDERAIEFILRQLLRDFQSPHSHSHSFTKPNRKRKFQEPEEREEPEENEESEQMLAPESDDEGPETF